MVVVTSLETLLLLLGLGGTPPFLPLPEGKPWTARAVKLVPCLVPTYQATNDSKSPFNPATATVCEHRDDFHCKHV